MRRRGREEEERDKDKGTDNAYTDSDTERPPQRYVDPTRIPGT